MEELYDTVEKLASMGRITELMYLWAPTPWMSEEGLVLRAAINSVIPSLAEHYNIVVEEGITFPDFVKEYDEQTYNRECDTYLDICLYKFAKQGDLRKIRTLINKASFGLSFDDLNSGMSGAAEGGHLDLVEFFIEKGANDWNGGMTAAARGGHLHIVKFFIEKGANDWNWGMAAAARRGHLHIVKFFIEKGANDWNRGMAAAARGGHLDIVKFFIEEKGADNWKQGLRDAAEFRHLDIVKFFIEEKGVDPSSLRKEIKELLGL